VGGLRRSETTLDAGDDETPDHLVVVHRLVPLISIFYKFLVGKLLLLLRNRRGFSTNWGHHPHGSGAVSAPFGEVSAP
jgi:hypothetical protein